MTGRVLPTIILVFLISISIYGQTHVVKDSIIRYDYLSGDTLPSRKTVFNYDQQSRPVREEVQVWPLNGNTWRPAELITRSYQGDKVDTITNWTYQGIWQPVDRTILRHLDLEQHTLTQQFDTINLNWTNESLIVRKPIPPQHTGTIRYIWMEEKWNIQDSTIALSSDQQMITSDTTYILIPFFNVYQASQFQAYQYDQQGNIILQTRYTFQPDSLAFVPRSRDTFAYDPEGFQTLSQFELWDESFLQWNVSLRIERVKNSDGLLDTSKLFFADFLTGQLQPTSKLEHQYFAGTAEMSGPDTFLLSVKNIIYQGPQKVPGK